MRQSQRLEPGSLVLAAGNPGQSGDRIDGAACMKELQEHEQEEESEEDVGLESRAACQGARAMRVAAEEMAVVVVQGDLLAVAELSSSGPHGKHEQLTKWKARQVQVLRAPDENNTR